MHSVEGKGRGKRPFLMRVYDHETVNFCHKKEKDIFCLVTQASMPTAYASSSTESEFFDLLNQYFVKADFTAVISRAEE